MRARARAHTHTQKHTLRMLGPRGNAFINNVFSAFPIIIINIFYKIVFFTWRTILLLFTVDIVLWSIMSQHVTVINPFLLPLTFIFGRMLIIPTSSCYKKIRFVISQGVWLFSVCLFNSVRVDSFHSTDVKLSLIHI